MIALVVLVAHELVHALVQLREVVVVVDLQLIVAHHQKSTARNVSANEVHPVLQVTPSIPNHVLVASQPLRVVPRTSKIEEVNNNGIM